MLVSEPDVFDLPLGVGGHGAALMVQEGVVHFDRDEFIHYGGSTILIKNAKKGGGKPYDNQVSCSGKVSKPFKKGYYKCILYISSSRIKRNRVERYIIYV